MTRPIDADVLSHKLKTAIDIGKRCEMDTLELEGVLNSVEAMPTIDAVPVRHGKWIYGNDFHWYTASCNKCGYQRKTDIKAEGWNQWKFCPNCGAKMQTGGD